VAAVSTRVRRAATRVAALAAVLVLWQVASTRGWTGTVVPTPQEVWTSFRFLLDDGTLGRNVGVSAGRVLQGMLIGVALGVALGTVVGLFRLGEDLIDPPLQALRLIPWVALVPFFIIWLGIGESSKIGLVALGTFFPVYLNVFYGIRAVDHGYVEAATSFGVGRWGVLWNVVLPGAFPQFLIGLRQAYALGWVVLVVAEQIAVDSGLGSLLTDARTYLRTDVLFVCMAVYAAFGLLGDLVIRLIEHRTLGWRRSFAGT
jgi:sulfonate transport system permease protein